MKKLKKQIFLLVFLILTVITTTVFGVYNAQLYSQQKKAVERSLNQTMRVGVGGFDFMINMPDEQPRKIDDFGNIMFMDRTVYTVVLDSDNSASSVINHANNGVSDSDIAELASKLMQRGSGVHIGSLYFSRYSYKYDPQSLITIVDNSTANEYLRQTAWYSIILFVLIEMLFVMVAKTLASKISKPVEDSFIKQKQFIADASHELKTPLAVIMASSDALEANPAERKWLDNIKTESDRMNKLIADLLDLAKSEAVDDKSQFAPANLSKIVEKSVLTFEGVMFEKGVLLSDDIQEGIELNVNEFKIQQLMSILLDNAVKHSETGKTVSVTLKKEKNIVLTVTNEGEGIPKGEEEKIFERVYRADDSRNRADNRYGLGLAIAKNICQSHNAQISAKSENGKTTFTVIFNI